MTGFVDTFPGTPVQTSPTSFRSVSLANNTTLTWPALVRNATNVIAKILEVTPTRSGRVLTLPGANEAATGEDALFYNKGGFPFTINNAVGGSVANVPSGAAVYLYLTDNSTVGGSWSVFTFGTGTSAADAAALAGMGLVASASVLNQTLPVQLLTADYTVTAADRTKCFIYESGTRTVTLPVLSGMLDDGFFCSFSNMGSGTITFTPDVTNTIDEVSSITLAPGETFILHGAKTLAKWFTVGRGRSIVFNFSYLSKNIAGSSNVTLSTSEAANKLIQFTGALTGNISVTFPNVTGVWYIYNNTSGSFSVTFKAGTGAGNSPVIAQSQRDILLCYGDSSNSMYQAITNQIASTAFSAGSNISPSITFIGDTNTGLFSPGADQVGVSVGGVETFRFKPAAAQLFRPINEAQGSDIASAISINLDNVTGNYVRVTGGVAIQQMVLQPGAERHLQFIASLTLINNATMLVQGGADYITTPGDWACVRSDISGYVYVFIYRFNSPFIVDGGTY